jgi:hypothetical protein
MAGHFKYYAKQMIEVLRRNLPNPLTARQLARQITGNVSDADIFIAIANYFPRIFHVFGDATIKLKHEIVPTVLGLDFDSGSATKAAARTVRRYANQIRPQVLPVRSITHIQAVRDRYLYEVGVDIEGEELRPADDTPVTLVLTGGHGLFGQVAGGSRDDAFLYVAFEHDIDPDERPERLVVDRKASWLEVAAHLGSLAGTPDLCLVLKQSADCARIEHHDSAQVADQLAQLGRPWARLLWGPPGAGKTFALAQVTERLITRSAGRVLIVAPSNVAVDAAVLEIVRAFRNTETGRDTLESRSVFRFGYPKDRRVLEMEELYGPSHLAQLSGAILDANERIQRLTRGRAPERDVAAARADRQSLQAKLRQCMADHVASAKVVATTIASVVRQGSPVLASGTWETVIADEASMICGAILLVLSSLARDRFLLAGDPRQLAPILEWSDGEPPEDVRSWLGRDAFAWTASDQNAVEAGFDDNDSRLARILCQRRCQPAIWSCVSHLYPNVLTDVSQRELQRFANALPSPGDAKVVLDLSSGRCMPKDTPPGLDDSDAASRFESACRKTGRSWHNPPTARLAIDVAREVHAELPNARVAIVTPYRAQVRLIRKWLAEETKAAKHLKDIEVGTVHSFQGGEADVVIFDMVDGPPRPSLGNLLSGDSGMRLVNVAITRARGKLIAIGDKGWVREKCAFEQRSLLRSLFLGEGGAAATVRVLPPDAPQGSSRPGAARPESPIEELFYKEIQKRESDLPAITLQYVIVDDNGRIVSRADFAFVEERLAVYCDGARYHLQKDQWRRDQRQRRELVRLGWSVLVFTGAEINEAPDRCVEEVVRTLSGRREAGPGMR